MSVKLNGELLLDEREVKKTASNIATDIATKIADEKIAAIPKKMYAQFFLTANQTITALGNAKWDVASGDVSENPNDKTKILWDKLTGLVALPKGKRFRIDLYFRYISGGASIEYGITNIAFGSNILPFSRSGRDPSTLQPAIAVVDTTSIVTDSFNIYARSLTTGDRVIGGAKVDGTFTAGDIPASTMIIQEI